jgi:hypothetical protein
MNSDQVITLDFLRADGRREVTRLYHHSLPEARHHAEWVFRKSEGLYMEVEIILESGYCETLGNLCPTVEDIRRI